MSNGLPTQYKLAITSTQIELGEPIVVLKLILDLVQRIQRDVKRDGRRIVRWYNEDRDDQFYVCAEAV